MLLVIQFSRSLSLDDRLSQVNCGMATYQADPRDQSDHHCRGFPFFQVGRRFLVIPVDRNHLFRRHDLSESTTIIGIYELLFLINGTSVHNTVTYSYVDAVISSRAVAVSLKSAVKFSRNPASLSGDPELKLGEPYVTLTY